MPEVPPMMRMVFIEEDIVLGCQSFCVVEVVWSFDGCGVRWSDVCNTRLSGRKRHLFIPMSSSTCFGTWRHLAHML